MEIGAEIVCEGCGRTHVYRGAAPACWSWVGVDEGPRSWLCPDCNGVDSEQMKVSIGDILFGPGFLS